MMRLTLDEARRMALAAQGFDRPRLARAARPDDLRRIIRRLGLVQLDYVKVLLPAHYTVFYSRLGPYPRELFERVVYGGNEFTEQWAHEASVIPVETWPLLRHRMEVFRIRPYGFEKFETANPGYCDWVVEQIRTRGPLAAEDLEHPEGAERWLEGSWFGSVPRAVLEMHFARGKLAVIHRRDSMARVFDLAGRVLADGHVRRDVERAEAQRALLLTAARAHGVGTAADLADYFRMPVRDAAPRLAELAAAGKLREAEVEGWSARAYADPEARMPRKVEARSLLAPFDPLVWFRPRTSRLFGFDYRFEIFVPAGKRKHGAYVLPFLMGERLTARVDLKADRAGGRLLVNGVFAEAGVDEGAVVEGLAEELRTMARWLELSEICVGKRGGMARSLARHLS